MSQDKPQTAQVPPVPGVFRLAWMLFMQPLKLRSLFDAWGLEQFPSLIKLWPRIRAHDPVVQTLLFRLSLLLFVVMRLLTFATAALFDVAGFHVEWSAVAGGVALGVVFGVAVSVAVGVAVGIVAGIAFGVAYGVASSVLGGVAVGVAGSAAVGVVGSVAEGAIRSVAFRVAVGVVGGVALGIGGGVAGGVTAGVAHGVAFGISFVRLPFWIVESILVFGLSVCAKFIPRHIPLFLRALPFRHHDVIFFPLPGLQSFFLTAAEQHPTLVRDLLTEAAVLPSQRSIVARTSAELQARDLNRAARDRTFVRAANLDCPFLPELDSLKPDSPLTHFQSAARDLDAGIEDQLQRTLALQRARKTMQTFIDQTVARAKPTRLEQALIPTARVWLDVIRDEDLRHDAERAKTPQIPRAFIAGPPLSPDRIENATLFKGRNDLAKLLAHDLDPNRSGVIIVFGQRRMGKSSLSHWLPQLLGTGTFVIRLDFQQLSGEVHREHPHRCIVDTIGKHFPDVPAPPTTNPWRESLDWLRALDASPALDSRNVLIVIDEVERVEDGIRAGWCSTDFLDFLRAAGDSLRHIRILLLTGHPLHRLGSHWVDRLISSTTRSLEYLDPASAEELVRTPIPDFPDIYPDGGVERILEQTHRHPFLVQKTCDELVKYLNAQHQMKATSDDIDRTLAIVSEEKLFQQLWNQCSVDEQRALQTLASASSALRADGAMRTLAREGIVDMNGDSATIAVLLFRDWIRQTQGTIDALASHRSDA